MQRILRYFGKGLFLGQFKSFKIYFFIKNYFVEESVAGGVE